MTPDALRALIADSGLSIREWARTVAGRDPRTVTRWLDGDPIPDAATAWLSRLVRIETTANRVTVTVER